MNTKLEQLKAKVEKMTPGKLYVFQAPGDTPHWRINAATDCFSDDKYFAWVPAEREGDTEAEANATGIVVLKNTLTPAVINAIEGMRAALEPFAELGAKFVGEFSPDQIAYLSAKRPTFEDWKKATAALAAFNQELGAL